MDLRSCGAADSQCIFTRFLGNDARVQSRERHFSVIGLEIQMAYSKRYSLLHKESNRSIRCS